MYLDTIRTLMKDKAPTPIPWVDLHVDARLVRLGHNLSAVRFQCMKLLPAHAVITEARRNGVLKPGRPVLASSSGTFADGLAQACLAFGHPLTIVTDGISRPPLAKLRALGVRVVVVNEPEQNGGYQQARLDEAERIRTKEPANFWLDQYDNPAILHAYSPVADLLSAANTEILVGVTGSGASLCGVSDALGRIRPSLRTVAVDTFGSVLFGLRDEPRLVSGAGNSIRPRNLIYSQIDEVHWLGTSEIVAGTYDLCGRHGLFMGPTSGAAYRVASWIANRHPDAQVGVLFPDEGHRYVDTYYNSAWVESNITDHRHPALFPQVVSHPEFAQPGWSVFDWSRREYDAVLSPCETVPLSMNRKDR